MPTLALLDFVFVTTISSSRSGSMMVGEAITRGVEGDEVLNDKQISHVRIRCLVICGEWKRHSNTSDMLPGILRSTSTSTNSDQCRALPRKLTRAISALEVELVSILGQLVIM